MKIDVHAHYLPERFIDRPDGSASTTYGIRISDRSGAVVEAQPPRPSGTDPERLASLERRLREMDELNVDMHALSVLPTLVDYTRPPADAVRACRAINDAFADAVSAHPARFVSLAHLPMQAPEEAAKELERAVKDLGARGAMIFTNINGTNLDDKRFAPFYAKMHELGVPVFLHPRDVIGAERLRGYHLGNLIGNPTDSAVAAASLIFGGVLKEFPNLKFYLAHGGGTCPYIRGRWDHGWRVRPEARVNIQRPPSEYFSKLYFDTLCHSVPALTYLIETVGPERVMLGSDFPADMADPDPVKTVASVPGISDREREMIYGENAAALFRI